MTNDYLWDHRYPYDDGRKALYEGDLLSFIDSTLDYFQIFFEKDLTAQEFADILKQTLRNKFFIRFVPEIPISNIELTQEFRNIIGVIRNKMKKEIRFLEHPFLKYRIDELKRYLAVYDARETIINGKKMKWINVCKLLYPKEEFSEEYRLSLLRDHRKARALIKKSWRERVSDT